LPSVILRAHSPPTIFLTFQDSHLESLTVKYSDAPYPPYDSQISQPLTADAAQGYGQSEAFNP
jgi:hypothetical protein